MKSRETKISPAEKASEECLKEVFKAIDENKNFVLEAGAGAGKTYTLIKALKYIINKREVEFARYKKRVACITYTNVAKDEIRSRTDNHPIVYAETIHAFCWDLVKDFQKVIKEFIPDLTENWKKRCEEISITSQHEVVYNLGYPKITESEIFLHHDDVIKIMTKLLANKKFVLVLKSRFPIILIDEYQDTNKDLAAAIIKELVEPTHGPLVGFFGDHWQKIYGSKSCGLITADKERMTNIGKHANFRSDTLIVDALNRLRPELKQHYYNPSSVGEITVFHTNDWKGERQTINHWQGDMSAQAAHECLESLRAKLGNSGWDFSADKTKILMLTNNILAAEQGFKDLFSVFEDDDDLLKKNDFYVSYFMDVLEPACFSFANGRFGDMFQVLNQKVPKIKTASDKKEWTDSMSKLLQIRETGTIKDVLDLLKKTAKPRLSDKVEHQERKFLDLQEKERKLLDEPEEKLLRKISLLHNVPYIEMMNAHRFVEDKTLFSTKHGVKGAEFENVIVVLGRGWNNYNWAQMLEYIETGVPKGKMDFFERNRNLFYVACSRPKNRLSLLFTQYLSDNAISALTKIFAVQIRSAFEL